VADILSIRQNLREVFSAEDVAQGCLSEQPRRPVNVFDVGDGNGGVRDAVVDDGVHSDRHRVLR